MKTDHVFKDFAPKRMASSKMLRDEQPTGVLPRNFECLRKLVRAYESKCGVLREYALKYVKLLVEACESLPSHDLQGDLAA